MPHRRLAATVIDIRINAPVYFVTLETSPFASDLLCVFENDGGHSNHGSLSGANLMQEFETRAVGLVRDRFRLGPIEEMVDRSKETKAVNSDPIQKDVKHAGIDAPSMRWIYTSLIILGGFILSAVLWAPMTSFEVTSGDCYETPLRISPERTSAVR
jgi:hypothetical protein